jgi:glutathione S-transferase
MYKLKLTYFDFPGGRGEPARLALHIGGLEFEDYRFTFDRFEEVRKTTPLNQVPTLFVDDKQITQSNGINRFVSKLAGLYPEDNFQALLCDEILEAMEDVTNRLVSTFGMQGDELQKARESYESGMLTQYLQWAEVKLGEQGGEFFIENRLTIADLKIFVWIRSLNSGNLDHISKTLVERVAPKLNQHCQRIAKTPSIVEYYAM